MGEHKQHDRNWLQQVKCRFFLHLLEHCSTCDCFKFQNANDRLSFLWLSFYREHVKCRISRRCHIFGVKRIVKDDFLKSSFNFQTVSTMIIEVLLKTIEGANELNNSQMFISPINVFLRKTIFVIVQRKWNNNYKKNVTLHRNRVISISSLDIK